VNVKETARDIIDITNRIYSKLKAGLSESTYRDAISAELELKGWQVQTEAPVIYKYKLPNGTVVPVGSGRIDILAVQDKIVLVIEVKTVILFLFRGEPTRASLQLQGYANAVKSEYPEYEVQGFLINFPVPMVLRPEVATI